MFYLDTSLCIASITAEPHTEAVLDWLQTNQGLAFAISPWVITEVHSALARKRREQQLSERERHGSLELFKRTVTSSLTMLAINQGHFYTAAALVGRQETGLRASDALHLAISSDHGATLATLDKKLAAAETDFARTLLVA